MGPTGARLSEAARVASRFPPAPVPSASRVEIAGYAS